MNKEELKKVAEMVRNEGVTSKAAKEIEKKARSIRLATLIAASRRR